MISFQAICSCSRVMDRTVNWNSLRCLRRTPRITPRSERETRVLSSRRTAAPPCQGPSHRNRDGSEPPARAIAAHNATAWTLSGRCILATACWILAATCSDTGARSQVVANRDRGKLELMVHQQWCARLLEFGYARRRHSGPPPAPAT